MLGYKHYSDDVVEAFCKAAVKNGIDRIRIFDALNDPRNMEAAIKYSKKAGAQRSIRYGIHNLPSSYN